MAVYYFEGAKILAPFSIVSNEPMYDTDTISLKKQRVSQGAQRWEMSFNVVNTEDTQVDSFLANIENLDSTSSMTMPQFTKVLSRKTTTSTSLDVATSAAIGDTAVSITKTLKLGIVPKGHFIKFSNHDKIYVLTSDLDLTGDGTATANIYPALTTALTSANNLNCGDSNVTFVYYRSIDDLKGLTFGDGVLSDAGTINLIEAV